MNQPTRVMLVEDNSRARRALKAYMSLQPGIQITAESSNGREAISLVKSSPPDIIIMDLQMPVMDGLEATKIIKYYWPGVKVIALTMYQNYKFNALSAGADAFLLKGCSMAELISTIHNVSQENTTDNP